jgi:hypothetical protein
MQNQKKNSNRSNNSQQLNSFNRMHQYDKDSKENSILKPQSNIVIDLSSQNIPLYN